jgi:hypothetical protein
VGCSSSTSYVLDDARWEFDDWTAWGERRRSVGSADRVVAFSEGETMEEKVRFICHVFATYLPVDFRTEEARKG